MSWYKNASSFIDSVGVESYSDSHAVVVIGTKRYLYSGTDGYAINNKVSQFRSMKNKQEAGRLFSLYLQKLKPYLQLDNDEESVQQLLNRSKEDEPRLF